MSDQENQQPHYLQKELYSLINKSLFNFIDKGSLDGIWYWDLTKKENMWISSHFWNILGYRQDEMEHLTSEWKHVIFEEDLQVTMEKLSMHLKHAEYHFNRVLRFNHKGGSTVWLRCRAMAIRNKEGKPLRIIAFHNNVTTTMKNQENEDLQAYKDEIAKLRKEIQEQSFRDYLTKIYNRRGLEESYKYLIEVAKRDGSFLSVAMFDIDNFKNINLEHGEAKGDKVLKAIADILIDSTRRVDIIGRFDAEEFIVLMPNTAKKDALMVSERIRKSIERKSIEGINSLSVSCGVATKTLSLEDDTQQIYDELNLSIDEALYHAKKNGRNQVLHYEELNPVNEQIEIQNQRGKYQHHEEFYS